MPDDNPPRKRRPKSEKPDFPLSQTEMTELEELAALGCTVHEAACWFDVGDEAMTELLRTPELRAVWRRGRGMGKIRLRRKQFELAEKNSTISALLGRQLLGQKEKSEPGRGGNITVLVDTGIDRSDDAEG
jgi:hypothetical protein